MSTESAHSRRSLVLYRLLVRLYPHEFRQRYEAEMLQTVQDWLFNERVATDEFDRISKSVYLIADILNSVIREHFTLWRQTMKISAVLQKIALGLLTAWGVIWVWFIGKWFLLLPLMDPSEWLLGKNYSSTSNSIFGAAMFLIPFLALLAFVIPVMKVQTRMENGDGILMVRLGRMSKIHAVVSWVCLVATAVLWGMVFLARMGLW